MSAKQHLVAAYQTWEELTEAESTAIGSDDWTRVHDCQRSKQGLQKRIIQLTEAAQAECVAAGLNAHHLDAEVRRIINRLMALESRNAELLAGRRAAADAARADLDQASQNLRRVQKSYSAPTPALWNSYS